MDIKAMLPGPLRDLGRNVKWLWRCCRLGCTDERIFLSTPPGHFYSPIPAFRDLAKHPGCSATEIPGIELRVNQQLELARTLAPLIADHRLPHSKTAGRRYYLDNVYFTYSDALFLQAILRHLKPSRIVEVGSGFSSAVMLDTSDDYSLDIQYTFIDPDPERLNALIADKDRGQVQVLASEVQQVPFTVFDRLGENDILFIDSSHVGKIASDVNHLFFEVLPRLRKGVWIHIHDIFWPFEYPKIWLEQGRAWNEAYLLRAYLMNNMREQIQLFPSYLEACHRAFVQEHLPRTLSSNPTGAASIWLKVC